MRRLFALLLLLLLVPAPASAEPPDFYITITADDSASGTNEHWPAWCLGPMTAFDCKVKIEDQFCGTSQQQFRIVLYQHENYGGDRVILCRQQKNFCNFPLHSAPSSIGCYTFGCCNQANDQVSSIAVGDITANGACLRIYDNIDFDTGAGESFLQEGTIYPNMAGIPGGIRNDEASSLKRVYAANCP